MPKKLKKDKKPAKKIDYEEMNRKAFVEAHARNYRTVREALMKNFDEDSLIDFLARNIAIECPYSDPKDINDVMISIKKIKVVYDMEAMIGSSLQYSQNFIEWNPSEQVKKEE